MHLLWLTQFALRFAALHHKDVMGLKSKEEQQRDDADLGVFEMVAASLDMPAIQFILRRLELYREEKVHFV